MKLADFRPELAGASPGERARYLATTPADPSKYGSFYACTSFAVTSREAWCECPRAENRQFEDAEEADLKGHVVWVQR